MCSHFRKSFVAALIAIFLISIASGAVFAANCGSDLAEMSSLLPLTSNFNHAGGQVSLFANGGPLTAPTAGTVLVDSGQLAAGCYILDVEVVNNTDTAVNTFQVAHRNAANAADVCISNPFGVAVFATIPIISHQLFALQIANQNERAVVRIIGSATSAKIWSADMTVLPCP